MLFCLLTNFSEGANLVLTAQKFYAIIIWVMEMEKNKELPIRKKNRLQNYDYSSCGAYFVTVCTDKRKNYFWKNVGATIGRPQDVELSLYGEIVSDAINNIPLIYPSLLVERYVIMPNHIHLLLRVCSDEFGRHNGRPYNIEGHKSIKRIYC